MTTGQVCRCGAEFPGELDACPNCGRPSRAPLTRGRDDSPLEIHDFLPESDVNPHAPGEEPAPGSSAPLASPARRMLEALVDPRAISWMLLVGGALAIVGLIIWLVSVGLFENPINKAIAFGLGTGLLLAAGWWLTLRTRFELAGQAITFLACVVAPLNLWFYHGQGLLSADDQLWIAGVICCAIYAVTLLILQRPLFIFAFQAGVTLTTLLFLASLGTLGVNNVVMALGILAVLSIHAEPILPAEGSLDRKRFGRPLIWGGLAIFGTALLVLLPAQIWNWMDLPASSVGWLIDASRLGVSPILATVVWGVGGYLALYVALVPRLANGWTGLAAIACLLMAETTALIGFEASAEGVIVALSLTSALACLLLGKLAEKTPSPVIRVARFSVVSLAAVPIVLGYVLLARGTMPSFEIWGWSRPLTFHFPIAMALSTVCQVAGILGLRRFHRDALVLRFFAAAAAVLTVAGAVYLADIPNSIRLAGLVAIPIGYLIAGMLRKDNGDIAIAHTLCGFFAASLFLAVCHRGLDLFIPFEGKLATLGTAIVMAEASLLLLLSAAHANVSGRSALGILLSLATTGTIAAAIWQAAVYGGLWNEHAVLLLLATGLLVVALRYTKLGGAATIAGASLILATAVVMGGKELVHIVGDDFAWSHLADLGWVVVGGLTTAALVGSSAWRRAMLATAGGAVALGLMGILSLAELSQWQQIEILAVLAGIVMLVAAHVGRFREQAGQSEDLVDAGLWFGAILTIVPPAIAIFVGRFQEPTPRIFDEIALVILAVVMLATGLGWRLKSTTILGGAGLIGYLVVLLAAVLRRPEVTMGAVLAGTGAALFAIGLLLSIYREYILSLPDRIKRREGLFRVLDWR